MANVSPQITPVYLLQSACSTASLGYFAAKVSSLSPSYLGMSWGAIASTIYCLTNPVFNILFKDSGTIGERYVFRVLTQWSFVCLTTVEISSLLGCSVSIAMYAQLWIISKLVWVALTQIGAGLRKLNNRDLDPYLHLLDFELKNAVY